MNRSFTFEFCLNPDDPDLVPIPLRLPAGIVSQIDAALEDLPTIRTRAELVELAVLYALRSLNADAAAIWIGGEE